ncbi:MAG: hypothetical protein JWQ81_6128 [Amycolatopsis sp.]|nr:hypothetical protein [Amycolatopsis sp.]
MDKLRLCRGGLADRHGIAGNNGDVVGAELFPSSGFGVVAEMDVGGFAAGIAVPAGAVTVTVAGGGAAAGVME